MNPQLDHQNCSIATKASDASLVAGFSTICGVCSNQATLTLVKRVFPPSYYEAPYINWIAGKIGSLQSFR